MSAVRVAELVLNVVWLQPQTRSSCLALLLLHLALLLVVTQDFWVCFFKGKT